jgi:fumarate hydratase class II
VIGEDNAVAFAGTQGNYELNTMRPIITNNFLHSARILGDGCEKFRRFSVEGTQLNREQITGMLIETGSSLSTLGGCERCPCDLPNSCFSESIHQ